MLKLRRLTNLLLYAYTHTQMPTHLHTDLVFLTWQNAQKLQRLTNFVFAGNMFKKPKKQITGNDFFSPGAKWT
jgi:hypothetical protein